jgi:hypothetical protein
MPTGNDHLRPLLGEGDGGGATDAGESAGDQDYWVAHILILAIARPYRQSMVKWKPWQRFRDGRAVPYVLPLGSK